MDKALPKWGVWKHIPKLSATEAIALTVNVEPTRVRKQANGKWVASTEAGANVSIADFEDRLFLFTRRFGPKVEMSLAELANWSQSVDWNIPLELSALAPWPDAVHDPAPSNLVDAALASIIANGEDIAELRQEIAAAGCRFASVNGEAVLHISDGTVKGRLEPLTKIYSVVCGLASLGGNIRLGELLRASGASGGGALSSNFATAHVEQRFAEISTAPVEQKNPGPTQVTADENQVAFVELFDGVPYPALHKMFPEDSELNWKSFAERASRNGLDKCRVSRGLFNPLLAAEWWLKTQKPAGWDLARCHRVLANNLPLRHAHRRHEIDPRSPG